MNHNQKVGAFGEKLAKEYLERRGYKIIDTNTRIRHKEIDIIAFKDSILVFVEVKTRTSDKFGSAQEAVVPYKTRKLTKAIEVYLEYFCPKLFYKDIRLDLISIDMDMRKRIAKIKHFKSIS